LTFPGSAVSTDERRLPVRYLDEGKETETEDLLSYEYRETRRESLRAAENARELVRKSKERQRLEQRELLEIPQYVSA